MYLSEHAPISACKSIPPQMNNAIEQLISALNDHQPALVLTGAGISTASGIPAYRNTSGEWVHPRPVLAAQFKAHDNVRRRYWRRSMSGWPVFNAAKPNSAHKFVTALQTAGVVSDIITQNVDGLHQAAGSRHVIELHGNLNRVMCLNCKSTLSRYELQQQLLEINSEFAGEEFNIGADGDATPTGKANSDNNFNYVACKLCNGMLKPDVVFFGENVPADIVTAGRQSLTKSGCLLCIGTSLTVLSGFRYCREAVSQNKPVYILNRGKTRADDIATLKADVDCEEALSAMVTDLCN